MAPSDEGIKSLKVDLVARYALAGAICATAGHTALVPADVIKTRMQSSPGLYSGLGSAGKQIVAAEGVGALLLGFAPTLWGYAAQGAFKFGGFEVFKKGFVSLLGPQTANDYRFFVYLASSSIAETLGSIALCPFEALRIRLVTQPSFAALGTFGAAAHILKSEGMAGYYKGIVPILFKQVPYTAVQLTTFQLLTDFVYQKFLTRSLSTQEKLLVTISCGTIAGVASAIASHPADTVLTRMNMKTGQSLTGAMKELGFKGLWLGVGARAGMVGLMSMIMFLINDTVKLAVGVPLNAAAK